jgi:hypothetical protein
MGGIGSNSNSSRICYKWATTSSETIPTFTNTSAIVLQIYRGIGDWDRNTAAHGSGGTINHPAVAINPGESWVARFAGSRNATNMTTNTPAGHTFRTGISTDVAGFDSNGPVGSTPAPSVSQSTNGSSGWSARAVELVPPSPTKAETFQDGFDSGSVPDPARWNQTIVSGGTITVSGGMLVLTAGTGQVEAISVDRYDLHESSVTFQVMSPLDPGQTGAKYVIVKGLWVANYVRWSLLPTGMRPSGSGSAIGTLVTGHLPGHWYRIRAIHRTAYFDYSTDGVNWINNTSTNFASNSRVLNIAATMSGGNAGVDTFMLDNLNMT